MSAAAMHGIRAALVTVVVMASVGAAPVAPVPPVATMSKSLARCCGTARATLGPLFGKLVIGELPEDLVSQVITDEGPAYLRKEKTGLSIDLSTGEGQYAMYLDAIEIAVPDHDLCVQLETRLDKMWGRRQPWVRADHHQAARLEWNASGSDAASCTLQFYRLPTKNPARCLRDEKPAQFQEIDVTRGCLKPARASECMLDRDRGGSMRASCSVDDKHHTFWRSEDSMFDRPCTDDELHLVDFYRLRDCD